MKVRRADTAHNKLNGMPHENGQGINALIGIPLVHASNEGNTKGNRLVGATKGARDTQFGQVGKEDAESTPLTL
jgi:hypothetical protein